MRIRNLPYDKLNTIEKKIVDRHYKGQMEDEGSDCRNQKCATGVREFWEMHRLTDTEGGHYNGWIA
jgi:hypothetical protein